MIYFIQYMDAERKKELTMRPISIDLSNLVVIKRITKLETTDATTSRKPTGINSSNSDYVALCLFRGQ